MLIESLRHIGYDLGQLKRVFMRRGTERFKLYAKFWSSHLTIEAPFSERPKSIYLITIINVDYNF